jgi:hypothetical protein
MLDKINWMLQELQDDGFNVTILTVENILAGDVGRYEPALIDYVLELDAEWQAE